MERKDSLEEDFRTAVALSVPSYLSNGRLSTDSDVDDIVNDFKTAMVLKVPS